MRKELATEWVPTESLVPWDKNPRAHQPIDEVAASIQRFGFANPILVRSANNRIIAGHTRWEAARKLGLETVPVRFLDLTGAEADALALADNKLGELAVWDNQKLREVLAGLSEQVPIDGLGWGGEDLETLLRGLEAGTGFLGNRGDGSNAGGATNGNGESATNGEMVDFVVPMTVPERAEVYDIIQRAKVDLGVTTTRGAVLAILRSHRG
jgi:hypothetical protein